jgi:hypothetical protein
VGATGPTGATGTFASTTCTWVNGASTTFPSNTSGNSILCPVGQAAVYGGWDYLNWTFANTCIVNTSRRIVSGSQSGWYVEWYSPPNNCTSHTWRPNVLCCTP